VNGLSTRRHREKCRVLSENYFHVLILFDTSRFNDRQYALKAASNHENEQANRKCMTTYYSRLKVSGHVQYTYNWQFNLIMTVNTGRKY
jgi:hypothetical protein